MKKNRIYRKYLAVFMLFCFVALMTAACGKSDGADGDADTSDKTQDAGQDTTSEASQGNVTRAEYIGLLGDSFGYREYEAKGSYFDDVDASDSRYAEIQACAEWEVIPAGGSFFPNEDITLSDALSAAVRAVRTDDIKRAGYEIDENALLDFYAGNIANIDTGNPEVSIDSATASAIVRYAADFRDSLEFPQVTETVFADGVKIAGEDIRLNYDGQTGSFLAEGAYEVGDVVYWDATADSLAKGIRITSIDGTSFQYVDAEVSDVFRELNISGTFDGTIVSVTTASEGTRAEYDRIYNDVNSYGMAYRGAGGGAIGIANPQFEEKGEVGVQSKISSNSVVFYAYAKGESKEVDKDGNTTNANAKMDLTVAVKNIRVTVDYKHSDWLGIKPEKVDAKVSYDTEITSNFTGNVSKTIALGEVDVNIYGPLFMRLSLTANIGADGRMTVSCQTKNVMNVCWMKNKGLQKSFNSDPSFTFDAEVTLTAEATALADVRVGFGMASASLINAEVTSGAVAIAKADGDLLKGEMCTDVLVFVPLRWGLNQRSCALTDISSSLKYKATIWDSVSSPVKFHLHFENGKRTDGDVCTRGEDEEVVQEEVDEYGDPLAELELFEFEPLNLEFIEITTPLVFLKAGESDTIGITSLPEGYTEADLEYTAENASVCKVLNGHISATGDGSTLVIIKTKDGRYSAVFSVTVFPDYTVDDFVPLGGRAFGSGGGGGFR